MEYDDSRYIKVYSTGSSASSLGFHCRVWVADYICAISLYRRNMDPSLRQRIIDETYKLFITKGINQTSFCDVALVVHKSKGAVIHHFPSKKQLIETVIKMRFFPASQLPQEMDSLAEENWCKFLQSYQNPIERAIATFPVIGKGNGLMSYMQFISSANDCMDEFPQMYRELLAREQAFLLSAAQRAVTSRQITVEDMHKFSKQALEMSIGRTFSHSFLKA